MIDLHNQTRPSDTLLKFALFMVLTIAAFGLTVVGLDAIYNGIG
jgi:hypothetical protein